MAKEWTTEEDSLLEANWGKVTLPELSKMLNRSEYGILIRTKRLGLGPSKDGQGLLTASQLSKALNVDGHTVTDYWIAKCGLTATRRITKSVKEMWLIDILDFWHWAEINKDKMDTRRFEPLTLGPEPEWMAAKRETDQTLPVRMLQIWTDAEDHRLLELKQMGLTHMQIGAVMGRSYNSIERRVARLRKKGGMAR